MKEVAIVDKEHEECLGAVGRKLIQGKRQEKFCRENKKKSRGGRNQKIVWNREYG